jgi:nitroreductase/FMN reductase [NAD(P)H]
MNGSNGFTQRIVAAVEKRFGEQIEAGPETPGAAEIARMLEHCTHRKWTEQTVAPELLRLLCAAALSAPSKSDLQQTDIVQVADSAKRAAIVATIDDMGWIMDAPVFLVF